METKAGRAKAGRAKAKREPELVRERVREQGMEGAGAWLEAMVGLGKLELRLPG